MAAVLSLHQPLAALQKDLADLLAKAVNAAGDAGTPADTRVHDLRKRLKRARAWALMLPPGVARSVLRELRDVHRSLASRRDLDATLEAIHRLGSAARHEGRDRARQALQDVALDVRSRLQGSGSALADLDSACIRLNRLADLLNANATDGDFADLAAAVAGIASRSRRAMRRAFASGQPADYHRWRKWMKYHAFHLRYLVPLWPELVRVEAATAEHCAAWLGESQDLELVRHALASMTNMPAARRNALLALLDREQHRLLHQAASAGLHLHALSPRALEKRLCRYEDARLHRHAGN